MRTKGANYGLLGLLKSLDHCVPLLTILDDFGSNWMILYPFWQLLDLFGLYWIRLEHFLPFWTTLCHFWRSWTNNDYFGPLGNFLDHFGSVWTIYDNYWLNWTILINHSLIWTVLATFENIFDHLRHFGWFLTKLKVYPFWHLSFISERTSRVPQGGHGEYIYQVSSLRLQKWVC